MLTIDGSRGEGGGQILRTGLSLALLTGTPFRIEAIRAGRPKPGLLRQHLTAVLAAAEVGDAEVEGAALRSRSVTFRPRRIVPGDYTFQVGTAGSATLVLQTVLPALVIAADASKLRVEGGTHNLAAPPFEAIHLGFLPLLARMGARVDLRLERHGFFPAGGGSITASIAPVRELSPIELLERGALRQCRVTAVVARLPESIATRELAEVRSVLGRRGASFETRIVTDSAGPGNVVNVVVESVRVTEVFTGFGRRGVRAERVAAGVAAQTADYLASQAAVGPHLADQLMIPLAMAGAGAYSTTRPTRHARTNAEVIRQFLDIDLTPRPATNTTWLVDISATTSG